MGHLINVAPEASEEDHHDKETHGNSSHCEYLAADADKPFDQREWLDIDSYPSTKLEDIADWRLFTQDFLGMDKKMDKNITQIGIEEED